jgi:hypothetical protein
MGHLTDGKDLDDVLFHKLCFMNRAGKRIKVTILRQKMPS